MAAASDSSASHRVQKRMRLDLPFIAWGEYQRNIMKEYRVKKECPNKGRIFYKCLDRNLGYFIT